MDNVGGVHGLQSTEGLVDEVLHGMRSAISKSDRQDTPGVAHLAVIISELLCPDDTVQVSLHEFLDDCVGLFSKPRRGG